MLIAFTICYYTMTSTNRIHIVRYGATWCVLPSNLIFKDCSRYKLKNEEKIRILSRVAYEPLISHPSRHLLADFFFWNFITEIHLHHYFQIFFSPFNFLMPYLVKIFSKIVFFGSSHLNASFDFVDFIRRMPTASRAANQYFIGDKNF